MTRQAVARLRFTDLHPEQTDLAGAVLAGLARRPKRIEPKFFYDDRGSKLFDAICDQPEYYLPDAEREILETHRDAISEALGSGCVLIEPGAGSAAKVRLFLEELRPSAYVPLDISGDYLYRAAHDLAYDFPWLDIHAACLDFAHSLQLPEQLPEAHKVAFFPGSSLGNFEPDAAVRFLTEVCAAVEPGGSLLIGVDIPKDEAILDAAYNDRAGVTAGFNKNLLVRIARELDSDVEPDEFEHLAFYNREAGRVEMHLRSRRAQQVRVNGETFAFEAGETIHTECSYKYDQMQFREMAKRAGFRHEQVWRDSRDLFQVHYCSVPD